MNTTKINEEKNVMRYLRFLYELYAVTNLVTDNVAVDKIFRKYGISSKVILPLVKYRIIYFEKHLYLSKKGEQGTMEKLYLFKWNTNPPDVLLASVLLQGIIKAEKEATANCTYCGDSYKASSNTGFCSNTCQSCHEDEHSSVRQKGWFKKLIEKIFQGK